MSRCEEWRGFLESPDTRQARRAGSETTKGRTAPLGFSRPTYAQTATKQREILWMNFEPSGQQSLFKERNDELWDL